MSQSRNLGLVKAIFVGPTAPSNTNVIWFDTTEGKHKAWNSTLSDWTTLGQSDDLTSVINQLSILTSAHNALSQAVSTIALDSLANVSVPSPTDGQALVWNSAQGQWVASTMGGGSGSVTSNEASAISVAAQSAINTVSAAQAATSAEVTSVKNVVSALSQAVSVVSQQVSVLSARVAGVSAQMTSADNAISNAVSIVSAAQAATSAELTSVKNVVSVHSQTISAISQQVSALSQNLSANSVVLSNAVSAIQANSADVTSVKNVVSVHSQAISAISQQVSALSQNLSANSVVLSNAVSAIQVVSQAVSVVSAAVVAGDNAVSANAASANNVLSQQISVISQQVSVLSQAVSALSQAVSVLSQQVSAAGGFQQNVVGNLQSISISTLANVSGLSISVAASGAYRIEAELIYNVSAISATGYNFELVASGLAGQANANGMWRGTTAQTVSTGGTNLTMVTQPFMGLSHAGFSVVSAGTANPNWVKLECLVVASSNAGSLQIQAKVLVGSVSLYIYKGSYIKAFKIA